MYIFCFYDDCTLISIYNYDKKALGILHTDWKGTLEDIINEHQGQCSTRIFSLWISPVVHS